MRLTSARLHPFGRFQDASWDLSAPIAVVAGPNETGKSTLRQAIMHALFTPSNLTPARLRDTLARWFPLPGGDHATVTLTFLHAGTSYTLTKRWGAAAAVSLTAASGTTQADPQGVATLLADMLGHNEATFRHVLCTGHDELERTLHSLETHTGELRDIRSLAQAATGGAGDVDQQQLELALAEKLKRFFNRWDESRQRPDRQNGQEKGIGNEWKQGVGEILAAWYSWQRLVDQQQQILSREQEIDRVTAELATLAKQTQQDEALLSGFGERRRQLAERKTLEERSLRLQADVAGLQKAFAAWPLAEAAVSAWQTRRSQLVETGEKLRAELSAARHHAQVAGLRASHDAILKAKADCDAAALAAANQPHPAPEILEKLERLDGLVSQTETQLAARELNWQIEPTAAATVELTRGPEPAETLSLSSQPLRGTAAGRFQFKTAGLTLIVDSGGADMTTLLADLANARHELADVLAACDVPTVAVAREQAARHAALAQEAATKAQTLKALLQGRSLADWDADVAAAASLPQTRDIPTLEAELESTRTALVQGDHEATTHDTNLAQWRQAHTNLESLGVTMLTVQQQLREAEAALAALPSVPEGFATAEAFIAALDAAQARLNASREPRAALESERGGLEASLGDLRSEDVGDQAETAKRHFERVHEVGCCYQRIAEVLTAVAAPADAALETFGDRVTELFSAMTDGTATLGFTGTLPDAVTRGPITITPEQLSQAAGGALALATRLALAETYLQVSDGFILLDDPLVHFDADRLAEAVDLLKTFAQRHQVIFFTCHDQQATLLEQVAG